jgi:hypothetical protein
VPLRIATLHRGCARLKPSHAHIPIPQTNTGNPKPDAFAFGHEHDCEATSTFAIPLDEIDGGVSFGDTVAIAARAIVADDTGREEGAWGQGTRFVERGDGAMYFTYDVQGCGDGGSKCVFVTSSLHDGDLTFPGFTAGLASADAICNDLAGGTALPGTYKAWLSTGGAGNSAAERLTHAAVPYRLVNGQTVAYDFTDLTTCDASCPEQPCLQHPINLTETGVVVPVDVAEVWTGTSPAGAAQGGNCDLWREIFRESGAVGSAHLRGIAWTMAGERSCHYLTMRLYCFQQ